MPSRLMPRDVRIAVLRNSTYSRRARRFPLAVILLSVSLPAFGADEKAPENPAPGAEASQEDYEFFESKVRPILVKRCQKCHCADRHEGGLQVDSRDALRAGGDQGPALVPGKPDESLLIRAIRHSDTDLQMPPDAKLPAEEIRLLEEWVRRGAVDPRKTGAESGAATPWERALAERRTWWCWQPVRRPPIPEVSNSEWPYNAIDCFLLARIERAGLIPAERADPATIARRLSFILTGLPPENGGEPEGLPTDLLADRYLASPHFGEHWARHWMDLVKYGDSHGSEHDPLIPHAWRYRDYLVRAFNQDLPYDRFVREHLAGDSLTPRRNASGINESPLATGFFRFVEFYPTPIDVKNEEASIIESQIDAFSKTFQGLTIACARCHDHKFDAISARDFQSLYGVFSSSRATMHRLTDSASGPAVELKLSELKRGIRTELAKLWRDQLGHWSIAIINSRDGAFLDAPVESTAIAEPGLVSLEAETARWRAALRSGIDRPTDPLWPVAQIARRSMMQCAEGNAGCYAPEVFQQVASARTAASAQRDLKLRGEFRLYSDFSQGNAVPVEWTTGERPIANDWHAVDNFGSESAPGDFAVEPSGKGFVSAVYSRGRFSHLVSNKRGGTFRSPNFELTMKFISVLAAGTHNARVRLIIENFQGDQVLFTSVMPKLTDARLQWYTLPVREVWAGRRAYLEVIPRDEMPYPGITPDSAALETDGRSGVGVRCVVFHDGAAGPELVSPLPDDFWQADSDWPGMAAKLTALTRSAIDAWAEERASDEQAQFIDGLLNSGVLLNQSPPESPLAQFVAEYRQIEAQIPIPTRCTGVADESGFDERFFPRGDYRRAGEPVPRRYLEALAATDLRDAGSGRRQLAEAVVDPRNPLTARVMVNRLWHHVFGVGLVKTVDNFGRLGELPSHPELLDWLAAEFVDSGWSIKHMLRLMVTSRAFQTSASASSAARDRDPDNRLLSHANVRRLPAESIRDSLLCVSGRLDRSLEGRGIPLPVREEIRDFSPHVNGPVDGNGRRSIYLEARRNYPQSFLVAFDQPKPVLTVGQRNVTSVPAQSLTLLNDPFVWQQAELFAKRFAEVSTAKLRISAMLQQALGREATCDEVERSVAFLKSQGELLKVDGDAWQTDARGWTEFAHALFNLKEFIYLH